MAGDLEVRVSKKHDRAALLYELASDDALSVGSGAARSSLFSVSIDDDVSVITILDPDATWDGETGEWSAPSSTARAALDAARSVAKAHEGKPLPREPDPEEIAREAARAARGEARTLAEQVEDEQTRTALLAVLDLLGSA